VSNCIVAIAGIKVHFVHFAEKCHPLAAVQILCLNKALRKGGHQFWPTPRLAMSRHIATLPSHLVNCLQAKPVPAMTNPFYALVPCILSKVLYFYSISNMVNATCALSVIEIHAVVFTRDCVIAPRRRHDSVGKG